MHHAVIRLGTLSCALIAMACATAEPTPASAAGAPAATSSSSVAPATPVARRQPFTRTLHGDSFVDDYFWLRNKGTPEVEQYLRAEDAFADAAVLPLAPLRETLFSEIVSHIAEDDESVPVKDGAWESWRRFAKGKQYPIFLRRTVAPAGGAPGPEQVLLDVNVLAEGKDFLGLGAFDVSDDGNRLLYSLDETGFRQFDLRFKDLTAGTMWPETIARVTSAEWAADSATVFYVVEDDAKRPYRLYRHTVGADPKTDALVYEETDARFELYLSRTTSRAFMVVLSESKLATEVRLIDTTKPASAPIVVEPRAGEIKYWVDHRGDTLWIQVNDTGRNFRVVTAPVKSPGKKNWREVVAHDDKVMIEAFTVFDNAWVMSQREGGLPHLVVHDFAAKKTVTVPMPEPDYSVWLDDNPESAAPRLRYGYTSLSTPRSVYTYDVAKGVSALVKEDPVPGGFDRTRYVTEYVLATAKDGTKVPISLIADKRVPKDGTAPLHLSAYGSYGYSLNAGFRPERLPLLDRGVVLAFAHIRGGGDLGKAWHEQGRLAHKMNTFTDFIACAEHLVAQKYASPARVTIEGGSAGGLLMGAVTNLRPELWKAVIAHVPFVDVLNTMNDPSLPLTVTEYEEWGNPGVAEQYAWMRAYSPYENLSARPYPTMLVKTSYNDSQVMYWEPAKYVARRRALKTDSNPLLFKIKMEPAGHGGKSGRYDRFRDNAFDQAFLLWQLGVVDAKGAPAR